MRHAIIAFVTVLFLTSSVNSATITKGLIGREDVSTTTDSLYPGSFTRLDSMGRTLTLTQMPDIWKTHQSVINARFYNGGARTDATIILALAAISTNASTLYLEPGTWTINQAITIPANVTLKIARGALLTQGGLGSIAFSAGGSDIDAGQYQIFSGFTSGQLTGLKEAYPQWWGAKDDGSTDAAAAITACVAASLTTRLEGTTFKINSEVPIVSGHSVIGDGKVIVKGGTAQALKALFHLYGTGRVEAINFDCNNSFTPGTPGTINSDGFEFGIIAEGDSNVILHNTMTNQRTVGIMVAVMDATTGGTARYNLVDGNIVTGYSFADQAGQGVGGIGIAVESIYPTQNSEKWGDFHNLVYTYSYVVASNRIINNILIHTGVAGIIIFNSAYNTIANNSVDSCSASAIEIEPKAIGNAVIGNTIKDFGANGISVAYGSFDNIINGNVIEGTGTVGAVNIFYGAHDNLVSNNTIDSHFDVYSGTESRKPGAGITIGQYCKNTTIEGNLIKGYNWAIYATTTYYPGAIASTDPEYYQTGFENLLIAGNIIQGAYALASTTGSRTAMPQNTLYGIWLYKNTAYDDVTGGSYGGALTYSGIVVNGNVIDGVEYPFLLQETTASGYPHVAARFSDVSFKNNTATNCTSGAGYANLPLQVGIVLSAYNGANNSWNYRDLSTGPGPNPSSTPMLTGNGEINYNTNLIEMGTGGSKYLKTGYIFDGNTNSFYELRTLTGN